MKKIVFYLGLVVILMVCSPLCRGDGGADQASTNPEKYDEPSEDPTLPPGIGIVSPIPPETVEAELLLYKIVNKWGEFNQMAEENGFGKVYPNAPNGPIFIK